MGDGGGRKGDGGCRTGEGGGRKDEVAAASTQSFRRRAAATEGARRAAVATRLQSGMEAHQLLVEVSECRGVWTATTPMHNGLLAPAWEVKTPVGVGMFALFHGEKLAPDQTHVSTYDGAMSFLP